MTLPRRHSRKLTLGGVKYRWMASAPHFTIAHGPFTVTFHAHLDEKPAHSILQVSMHEAHCSVVTPDVARTLIQHAFERGWDPRKKGNFNVSPDDAIEYLGHGTILST